MTQSAKLSYQTPNPMKKKVVIALLAVLIGHSVVLWGVSQMKVPELPAIEKEPIKVRLVKIKEDVPPPPPPPPKPKKEPVKPKEVKIVKKAEPPPLAKEIKKIEKTKAEAPKVVNEAVITPPTPSVVISTTTGTNKTVVNTTPTPDPAPRTQTPTPAPTPAPPASNSPQRVSIGGDGGVEWRIGEKGIVKVVAEASGTLRNQRPKLSGLYVVTLKLVANGKGKITAASINKSSGVPKLDEAIRYAISKQSFKPTKDGVEIYVIQPFNVVF